MLEFSVTIFLLVLAMTLLFSVWFANAVIKSGDGDKDKTYSLFTKINNIQLNNDNTTDKTSKIKINKWLKVSIVALFLVILLVTTLIGMIDHLHKIDVNHCTYEELTKLYGIGEVRSNLIINNRPYTDKVQLLDLLGTELYNNIKDKITVKEGP